MALDCQKFPCEIRKLCADMHKIGCGREPCWLAILLFIRNLVVNFSIFTDTQKQDVQVLIFSELAKRNPTQDQFKTIVNQLEKFIVNNGITQEIKDQLKVEKGVSDALVHSINGFLTDSLASEEERSRLINRFGQDTLETLANEKSTATMVPKLQTLVMDMLQHYRDEAQSWERKAKLLEKTVNVDPLLAPLHNRRALDNHLRQVVIKSKEQKSPLSVLMIDVDNFKININDIYGHQVGDDILRTLAKILDNHASRNNWFAARYGGDELVLVCELPVEKAVLHADAIRFAVQNYEFKPRIGDKFLESSIKFTVSIGIAEYNSGWTPEEFLNAADQAMYKVKGTGKNNVASYSGLLGSTNSTL